MGMRLVLELGVADLAGTRFAISPLAETLRAVQLLGTTSPPAVNRPWVRWARAQLDRQPLRLPRLWPLLVIDGPYRPEFLFPAPTGKSASLGGELAQVRATPGEVVRLSLGRVFGDAPWPASAIELAEQPRESLEQITAEVAECHDRLISPHWERLRSVLDADIAYHAGLLAAGGARSLFSDLHPDFRWTGRELLLTDAEESMDAEITLGPDGLVLVPSVFIWPEWSVKRATSTQTTLSYQARGVATVWEDAGLGSAGFAGFTDPEPAGDDGAVEALLGAPRARLLGALRSPATTSALARRFHVTPSAVSQHLAVLHRGGLVDRQRSGRTVLYQASDLGLAVLATGARAGSLRPFWVRRQAGSRLTDEPQAKGIIDGRQHLLRIRDRRHLHRRHRRCHQGSHRARLQDPAQPRLVRGHQHARPHRGRQAQPLPGHLEGRVPAG
jgi:DNA-binding transcriptional ArsR family regulator